MPIDLADEIFTVEDAANYAKVSTEKIRAWLDEGLRHMRTADNANRTGPRMIIVRKSALLAFIEAREVGATDSEVAPQPGKASPKRPRVTAVVDDPYNLMRKPTRRGR